MTSLNFKNTFGLAIMPGVDYILAVDSNVVNDAQLDDALCLMASWPPNSANGNNLAILRVNVPMGKTLQDCVALFATSALPESKTVLIPEVLPEPATEPSSSKPPSET